MIISVTGHRPNKLGGYGIPNSKYNYVVSEIEKFLKTYSPEKVITGMALGVDQWTAQICILLNIPFLAAVPFKGQESLWNEADKKNYYYLLKRAAEVKYVCKPGYSKGKMQIRNRWMVDNSDMLLVIFDGSSGGTKNCYNYALSKNKDIYLIDLS